MMPDGSSAKALRILLVEDNEADRKIALRAFGTAAFPNRVTAAGTGEEALDCLYGRGTYAGRIAGERPDVLVLDLNMPGMDGFEVLARLKKDPAMREIPIIVMTTSRHSNDVLRAFQSGAVSYVPKAADYSEFARTVNELCGYWTKVTLLPGRTE